MKARTTFWAVRLPRWMPPELRARPLDPADPDDAPFLEIGCYYEVESAWELSLEALHGAGFEGVHLMNF